MIDYYDNYDEINAELRALAAVAEIEAARDVKRVYIGGGEIIPVNLQQHTGEHGITFFTEARAEG